MYGASSCSSKSWGVSCEGKMMDVAVPLLVTHLLFFSHSGISMTLQSSETNPSTTAHVWVCRLPDEAWSPRYLAPWGMWSTPVSQPKERSGMKLLLPWSFLTAFQISNALTFGPLIHHFIIYEILPMECSLINFFLWTFSMKKTGLVLQSAPLRSLGPSLNCKPQCKLNYWVPLMASVKNTLF